MLVIVEITQVKRIVRYKKGRAKVVGFSLRMIIVIFIIVIISRVRGVV